MSEVQFAKTFLALLDRKAVKLNSDYVSDPRKYPAQVPYILPKPSNPFPKKSESSTTTADQTKIDITLTPMKDAASKLTLSAIDINTSLLDVKTTYASQTGRDPAKIKMVYNKRPASDLKSLRELLPKPTPGQIELTVMILGGSTDVPAVDRVGSPAIQIPEAGSADVPLSEAAMQDVTYTGKAGTDADSDALKSEAFWSDLQGFLTQRLRDDKEGQRLVKLFRSAAGI